MTNKLVFAALAATAVAAPAAAQTRLPAAVVAVVDTGRVYSECTACRSAVTTLQGQINQLQQRRQALGAPLQTEANAIQTAFNALPAAQRANPPAALKARADKLSQQQEAANAELQRLSESLQSTQQNVRQQIDARLAPVINQVMTQKGANVAVDTDATLARSSTLDITNDVLAQLNAALPSVSVTPQAQAQQPQAARPAGR